MFREIYFFITTIKQLHAVVKEEKPLVTYL
jgi:hypothetical protein